MGRFLVIISHYRATDVAMPGEKGHINSKALFCEYSEILAESIPPVPYVEFLQVIFAFFQSPLKKGRRRHAAISIDVRRYPLAYLSLSAGVGNNGEIRMRMGIYEPGAYGKPPGIYRLPSIFCTGPPYKPYHAVGYSDVGNLRVRKTSVIQKSALNEDIKGFVHW